MVRADAAIIGGTGIGSMLSEWDGATVELDTEYGEVKGRLVDRAGLRLLTLQRHSAGHATPPHLVNYRAIATALKAAGVQACVASAAVGSLRADWMPGTLAVCTDMVDLTFRRITLYEQDVVHTDFSTPFPISKQMADAFRHSGHAFQPEAIYFGLDGPRYETPAEIRMLQKLGGDVVGMTASTEAIVMREAGVPYGCLAVVTNLGCGIGNSQLDHGEVVDVMKQKGETVLEVLMKTLQLAVTSHDTVQANT